MSEKNKKTVKKIKQNFAVDPKGLNYEEKIEHKVVTKHYLIKINKLTSKKRPE